MTTIIVTGVGHSGTSMAAGVLIRLGLPMGTSYVEGIFEDQPLRTALYHFYHDERANVIRKHNAMWKEWGFKYPSLHRHIQPPEVGQFRYPRMVVMHRDALRISQRAKVTLKEIIREQDLMIEFTSLVRCPVLHMSYEAAIKNSSVFVSQLAAFCNLKGSTDIGSNEAYIKAHTSA